MLVAPDAFKGSLTAAQAATAMARGVLSALPRAQIRQLPLADGGDGSVDALVLSGFDRCWFLARGPTGQPQRSSLAHRGTVAVVEVANSCGLLLLPDGRLEPLASGTAGLGDAILAALDLNAEEVVVCLGGSASTDGGAGMLGALGARMLDAHGVAVMPTGGTLGDITELDLAGLDPRLSRTRFTVAADVWSPLLGEDGAAAVFGPQKGADLATVRRLEDGLRAWSTVLTEGSGTDVSNTPGAGAAGGTGAALLAVLSARSVPGSAFIQSALGLAEALEWADVVIVGEGRLDRQSTLGKGALSIAARARDAGVLAVAACGSVALSDDLLDAYGLAAWGSVIDRAHDAADAMHRADEMLATVTAALLSSLEI